MSSQKRRRSYFVTISSLVLAVWFVLMGVLILKYGMIEENGLCGRLCGIDFAFRQYFGKVAYDRFVAIVCFVVGLFLINIAIREARQRSFPGRRRQRK